MQAPRVGGYVISGLLILLLAPSAGIIAVANQPLDCATGTDGGTTCRYQDAGLLALYLSFAMAVGALLILVGSRVAATAPEAPPRPRG